jgi:hypothetical protein
MRSVRRNALEGADEGATERRSTQASTNLQHDAIHNLMAKAEAVALDNRSEVADANDTVAAARRGALLQQSSQNRLAN